MKQISALVSVWVLFGVPSTLAFTAEQSWRALSLVEAQGLGFTIRTTVSTECASGLLGIATLPNGIEDRQVMFASFVGGPPKSPDSTQVPLDIRRGVTAVSECLQVQEPRFLLASFGLNSGVITVNYVVGPIDGPLGRNGPGKPYLDAKPPLAPTSLDVS